MVSRAERSAFGDWWWTVDRSLLACLAILMLAGLVFLMAGGPPVAVSPADLMVEAASLNPAGTHVAFTSQAPDQAPEAYVSRADRFIPARVSRVQDLPPYVLPAPSVNPSTVISASG